ncbi:hypothetical protein BU018_13035, partial [Staphylococcus simulans]
EQGDGGDVGDTLETAQGLEADGQRGVFADQGDGLGAQASDAPVGRGDHALELAAQRARTVLDAGQRVQAVAVHRVRLDQLDQEAPVAAQLQVHLARWLPGPERHALEALQQHGRVELVGFVALAQRLREVEG